MLSDEIDVNGNNEIYLIDPTNGIDDEAVVHANAGVNNEMGI